VRGSPPEIRLAIRQARARPVMEDLRAWLDATLQTLSAKSDMAGAIRYALSRWTALTRYLDDGTAEIDNNAAERALRVVALGRKNCLAKIFFYTYCEIETIFGRKDWFST
jgi:hypothetical protein